MLAATGLINQMEFDSIKQELEAIESRIERGETPFKIEWEDIHMHIEQALIDALGDTGRKLHTARSRNDQIATDLRLWVRDHLDQIDSKLVELQKAFLSRCHKDRGVIVPALHSHATCPASPGCSLLVSLHRKTRTRPRSRSRLSQTSQRFPFGMCCGGWD